MVSQDCPSDAAWLAWLRDPLDVERDQQFAAHLDRCHSCQKNLEQLDTAERRAVAASGDDLLEDLRSQPPPDELECEPECFTACIVAEAAAGALAVPAPPSRQPDASDVETLTHRGHYEILGVLGQGSMGVVYKARNRKMDRLVAIKVLPPRQPQLHGVVVRFEREMKAVACLTHPNIVTAYDADEADGKHFLVMEYIEGLNLKLLVKAQGPLPVAVAVAYLLQAARGLHHAHAQGIIHRDVKPANLMVDRSGLVKVLDLGLAHFESARGNQADLTETGMLLGTVDYLAPEQAASARDIDGRADIYGLGCTLYYLLTERLLYEGGSVIQKVLAHREQPIPSLRDACPACSVVLEQVFAKMVAKRPEQRYLTMAEVIADLDRLRADLESPTSVAAGERPKPAPVSLSSVGPARLAGPPSGKKGQGMGWRWLPGKRRALRAVVLVLLVGLGAVVLVALGNRLHPVEGSGVPESKKTPPGEDPAVPLASGTQAGQSWDGNDLKMKFCWCPPGKFLMGSPKNEPGRTAFEESPQVEVVLSGGFWMGKFEVTQAEWEHAMHTTPSHFRGPGTLPVENITWAEATAFAARLTSRERGRGSLPPAWEFRLPTEAQWEYACRAGTTTAYGFGPTAEGSGDYMWYGYNADLRPHAIGGKKPNPWGLHDMHGNAWEWCRDWFQPQLLGGMDPEQTEKGTKRVMRGGGFNAGPEFCRTAFRSGQLPDKADPVLGFRVAVIRSATP